ncbi:aspartyl/asparaginyl beta-hydroxylase domain-containing protein [Streptantibioticus rubrisoli]|uniref:Aspartyl/asparaginyl beta-hydroxylase domain-containing protein n=1 Tax=Streptantibioticus rubrisoli TaxID=1387313 RepID=A0ABT1P6I7_9ACTN|nr:aspartyl/asparaginyl beta-hydroxylase domain-containing protein [Streptantibioticus rubrisoli]MCQ4040990.1 aspartyl/asparaginyl beta-hydroxylase domain-containing protein [Streptantibioticus rubrisoli]
MSDTADIMSVRGAWLQLPPAVPLDLEADAERLGAEVQDLVDLTWGGNRPVSQYGIGAEEEFDWKIISLRSPGGESGRTDPGGAGLEDFLDTPVMERCPYHAEILSGIPAPLYSVRLMALGPGASTHEHRDGRTNFPWGVLRLHIPVVTQPGAELVVDGETFHWEAGRLWYADFDRPHVARNRGSARRIHIVIDCGATVELLELFPADYLRRLPWSDVLLSRDVVPIQRSEIVGFQCEVDVPANFPDWSDETEARADQSISGAIKLIDERLTLIIDGAPRFGLVHIGSAEFRLQGWTEERTIKMELDGQNPRVRFRVRCGRVLEEEIKEVSLV